MCPFPCYADEFLSLECYVKVVAETGERRAASASFGEFVKNADFQISLPGILIPDVCSEPEKSLLL